VIARLFRGPVISTLNDRVLINIEEIAPWRNRLVKLNLNFYNRSSSGNSGNDLLAKNLVSKRY